MTFPRYGSYRDCGVERLGELPSHWGVAPLKALASFNDEVLTDATEEDKEIEYLEISGVRAEKGVVETSIMPFGHAPSRARRKVRDGDIVISTVRTYLRAVAVISQPPPNLVVSTGFAVIRAQRAVPKFLGYALRSEPFIAEVIARSVGISYPAINASDLVRISVAVPPEQEQVAIAAFLDRETGKIDALVEEQKRLIASLKEKRQAVISHAVTRGLNPDAPMKDSNVEWLGEVPAHWNIVPIRALFRFVKRQNGDDLEVLSVYRDYGVIRKSDRDDNNNKTPEDLSSYQTIEPGDLVVNKMKAWQGSLGVSQLAGITSPDYAVFYPTHDGDAEFLNYLLRCQLLPDVYRVISNGIRPDQWRLEPDKFKELKVPFPPKSEQVLIRDTIRSATHELDELAIHAEAAINLLQERRSALISAAVTGKIDVRGLVPDQAEAA